VRAGDVVHGGDEDLRLLAAVLLILVDAEGVRELVK
jgi:hypothetical protein